MTTSTSGARWTQPGRGVSHRGESLVPAAPIRELLSARTGIAMAALLIAHMRRGNIKVLLVSGLALGFASVIVGLRYDVGPMHVTWLAHLHPSLLLRAALTITGTAGLFFVVTGIALRRRAREEAELG